MVPGSQVAEANRPHSDHHHHSLHSGSLTPYLPPKYFCPQELLLSYLPLFQTSHSPSPHPGPWVFLELLPAWALPSCACAMDCSNPNK